MVDVTLLMDWSSISFLVFGGCCSNVLFLEELLGRKYQVGVAITFLQFVVIAALSIYPNTSPHSSWWKLYLRKPRIPLLLWTIQVTMFFTVSLLNNIVLNYNLPIPLHIVLRSSGTIISIIVGYLFAGKRYTSNQVVSSIVIASGSIIAASVKDSLSAYSVNFDFVISVTMMVAASLVSAFMGLHNERIYQKYGKEWQEGLFYTHFLGIPFFLLILPKLKTELHMLTSNLKTALAGNLVTQYLCIKGVNRLAVSTSSLTVNIVLLLRKFTSLLLSVFWFGNKLCISQTIGILLVFGGAANYSIGNRVSYTSKNR